tara:strand:+ start:1289 stop:1918 length:630 start_codon:yes stop_codon:yes gene_type:complete
MAHTIYKNESGKRLKSVTTIINGNLGWNKGALIGWTRKHCLNGEDSMKLLKEAGRIGTLAHNMIEEYINGGSVCLDDYTPSEISQAKTAYYGFYKWFEDNDVTFLDTEMKLVSEQYQFGGTFDAICEVNGKLVICDWKTTSDTYSEMLIQLGAYRQLIKENLGFDIRGAILLRLDKEENGYEEHHYKIKDLNWGWKMFKLLLKIQENKR